MRLSFQRHLPFCADTAWSLLTDPARMSTWSRARIELVAAGDGGRSDSVGTLRRVHIDTQLLGWRMRLDEVVAEAEPPRRLVYCAVDAPLLRGHRGQMRIAPAGSADQGCELTWEVDFELAVSPLEPLMRSLLSQQIEASLDALGRCAVQASGQPVYPRPFSEPPDGREIERHAEATLSSQRELADRLEATGDPKRWFARVYEYVTEEQLAAVRRGAVRHPRWVLALIPRFHDYFIRNVERWERGERTATETQWQRAFLAMEGKKDQDPRRTLYKGLRAGIIAHIEEDLPRALAEIWVRDYAVRCDYVRMRADFLLMSGIFRAASKRLVAKLPRKWVPWWLEVVDTYLPELVENRERRRFYDVRRARRLAFERGERLAQLLLSASRPSSQ